MLDQILALPTGPATWREVDFGVPSEAAQVLHLRAAQMEHRFLTTVTMFQAPQSVLLDELRIETWFPVDQATEQACRQLGSGYPAI